MMDLLNSTALYSKNVLNVLSSTISLIFLHMPCRINHFHHLIAKSHEISGLILWISLIHCQPGRKRMGKRNSMELKEYYEWVGYFRKGVGFKQRFTDFECLRTSQPLHCSGNSDKTKVSQMCNRAKKKPPGGGGFLENSF